MLEGVLPEHFPPSAVSQRPLASDQWHSKTEFLLLTWLGMQGVRSALSFQCGLPEKSVSSEKLSMQPLLYFP